jgi:hypothetical protein
LFLEIDHIMIEYPEIRPYFYHGKPAQSDDPNRLRVESTAEVVLDVFEWVWHRQEGLNPDDKGGWLAYMLDTFCNSPALREHYRRSAAWYPVMTRMLREHPGIIEGSRTVQ